LFLAPDVAAIALALPDRRFCLAPPIGRNRSPGVHFGFELAGSASTDETTVAVMGLD
jgi:hypothetical protein